LPCNYRVNKSVVSKIASVLSHIDLETVFKLEAVDPQFVSIKKLSSYLGVTTPVLTYLNALISYQLSCKGELYWNEFCRSVPTLMEKVAHPVDLVIRFVETSSCNRLRLGQKRNRLLKVRDNWNAILNALNSRDYIKLWLTTQKVLNARGESKTVAFSIKMFYYGLRAIYREPEPIPYEIPIPVDRRISKISFKLGLIDNANNWTELLRCPNIVATAWYEVGIRSGIPPQHIDSIIWPLMNKANYAKILKVLGYNKIRILIKMFGLDSQ